jgi:hypothetical protein
VSEAEKLRFSASEQANQTSAASTMQKLEMTSDELVIFFSVEILSFCKKFAWYPLLIWIQPHQADALP